MTGLAVSCLPGVIAAEDFELLAGSGGQDCDVVRLDFDGEPENLREEAQASLEVIGREPGPGEASDLHLADLRTRTGHSPLPASCSFKPRAS